MPSAKRCAEEGELLVGCFHIFVFIEDLCTLELVVAGAARDLTAGAEADTTPTRMASIVELGFSWRRDWG